MKGIILAGGAGTRLHPLTKVVSKQLQAVYDKPLIYYPLSTLMLANIKDILVITTPEEQSRFIELLGDGSNYGINLSYAVQPEPKGLAQAFTIGEKFIGDDECALILGDNIFYGEGFVSKLHNARLNAEKGYATIFGVQVPDPERFGIMELDRDNNVLSVEEKPKNPKSNYCITGLYFYPAGVSSKAWNVRPSERGEVEITTLNDMYLKSSSLKAQVLHKAFHWLDAGTMDSLLDAGNFIRNEEKRTDSLICCPEQIAYQKGWLSREELLEIADSMKKNRYGEYLFEVANEDAIIETKGKVYVRR